MTRKLRLCFFAPWRSPHTTRCLDHLSSLGHEAYLFVSPESGFRKWGEPEPPTEGSAGVPFRPPRALRAVPLLYGLLEILRRRQLIRRHVARVKPDIVHALWLWENAFDMWLTGVRPRLVTAWGSDLRDVHLLSRISRRLMTIVLRGADAMTAPSQELLDLSMMEGVKRERCHLIAMPGIDLARFENISPDGIRASLRIPEDAEIILSARAVQPFYRIDTIVHAFRRVLERRPRAILLILVYNHTPEYVEEIRRQIAGAGLQESVRLLEELPNPFDRMPELYAASAVMVSIPEADGMPNTTYEAFAAGCPIVASDLTTYDGVLDDGRTGLRVRGDDADQVAQAILRLLEDDSLRQRIIANGRAVVRARGNINIEMAKLERLYYHLLQGRGGVFDSDVA